MKNENEYLYLYIDNKLFCSICGQYFSALKGETHIESQKRLNEHIKLEHSDMYIKPEFPDFFMAKPKYVLRKEVRRKEVRRHPLKPWKDPESLFCDTEFLTKLLGKEPLKGKECRG